MPLPQLRPAAPKAGTGLLPHLPAAHQGCHQDLQAVALLLARPRQGHLSEAPVRWATPRLPGSPKSEAISHLPLGSDEQGRTGVVMRPWGARAQAGIASGSDTRCPQKPVPRFSSGTAWQITCLLVTFRWERVPSVCAMLLRGWVECVCRGGGRQHREWVRAIGVCGCTVRGSVVSRRVFNTEECAIRAQMLM